MTIREAWKAVEDVLTPLFGTSPLIPLSLISDDNLDAMAIPDIGGARLYVASGSEKPYSSPGGYKEPVIFVVEINVPKGSGNALVQDYAETIRNTFRASRLGNGNLICTRTQSDFLGTVSDGRDFYRCNAVLVFDNLSYH